MIQWVRSVLGFDEVSGKRTVLGNPVQLDLKEAQHVHNSDKRLKLLQTLCNQYKGTPHELKINQVYEKTKNIHAYLIDQKKATALEIFHLQNTDHFINTFALIRATHAKNKGAKTATIATDEDSGNLVIGRANQSSSSYTRAYKAPRTNINATHIPAAGLAIPAIAIDTFSRINYVRFDASGDPGSFEIGFTSSYQDKEYFLATIATRIGLYKPDITYVGNTQVLLPDTTGSSKAGYVPVINWRGSMYAVSLSDYRLFPVRINRNNS